MRAMCSMPEKLGERRDALRKLFESYITASPEIVATQVNALVQRLGTRASDDCGFSSDGSIVSASSVSVITMTSNGVSWWYMLLALHG